MIWKIFYELCNANKLWILFGLIMSILTYIGTTVTLWVCTNGLISFFRLIAIQLASTFTNTVIPTGIGSLTLIVRFLKQCGFNTRYATISIAIQQIVQVIVHIVLLIIFGLLVSKPTNLLKILL